MTISYSRHGAERAQQRHISSAAVERTIGHGRPARQANNRLVWTGPDGTVVLTDDTATTVVTVLGKRVRAAHDRPGAGRSRHDRHRRGPKNQPGTRA